MAFTKGTRVRASQVITTRFQKVPRGTEGEVIAEHPRGLTVEWDQEGLLLSAFDPGSARRLLGRGGDA